MADPSSSAPSADERPPSPTGVGDLPSNRSMSRLEARLILEAAVEARFPRLIQRKPVYGGLPIGM